MHAGTVLSSISVECGAIQRMPRDTEGLHISEIIGGILRSQVMSMLN